MAPSPNEKNFLKTRVSFGIILRADLEAIDRIKSFLEQEDDVNVIYQKVSGSLLWITEAEEKPMEARPG
jgi:hypothetical protein